MRSTGFLVAAVVENPSGAVENVGEADKPRFPGTTVTAVLTGYDRKLHMVNFASAAQRDRMLAVAFDGLAT